MKTNLYPLKFSPILKEKIWGGHKLKNLLKKDSNLSNIGESWEISDIENESSIVSEGALKGKSLKELLKSFKADLIGHKNYSIFKNQFPLLIKFIDAKEDLSIQLHPNNDLAAERHDSFGKTEMWYVMQANKDANLIVGFNQDVTPENYLSHLEDKTLTKILNFDSVKSGDAYFIDVGRVHAIGAGVMLAEIQQTSDITYRVFDWDRTDDQGNTRELHNDLAIDAIDFNMKDDFRIHYSKTKNTSNKMVTCPYFTTNFIFLNEEIVIENDKDSFIIYMCVEGEALLKTEAYTSKIKTGETVLMPAAVKEFRIFSESAKLLEVYV